MHFVLQFFTSVAPSRQPTGLLLGLLTVCLFATPVQASDSVVPGIGSLLFGRPFLDSAPGAPPLSLTPHTPGAGDYDDSVAIAVQDVIFSGNTVLSDAQLKPLLSHLFGRSWTLAQLMNSVQSIANLYAQLGYPFVSVSIPEQTIEEGVLELQVLEATWGNVVVEKPSNGSDRLLRVATENINKGQLIRQIDIDRSSALLTDIVGLSVSARLKPGEEFASSDLLVTAENAATILGDFGINNFGSVATRRTQASVMLQLNGLAMQGETLALDGLSSGEGMNRLRTSLEWPLNFPGMRLGAAYGAVDYQLVGSASSTGAHGWAQQGSLWLRQSLLRAGSMRLNARFQIDNLDLNDLVSANDQVGNPRGILAWVLSLGGDMSDKFLLGGSTTWALGLTQGQLQVRSDAMRAYDAALANTQGRFTRLNFSGSHVRDITNLYSLNALLDVQFSDRNLDSSQKASLGGARSLRAYEPGVLSGDASYSLTMELKRSLGELQGVQWAGLVFGDFGWIKTNAKPWTDNDNDATIASIGLGMQGALGKQWRVSFTIANAIGALPPAISGSQSRHSGVWLEIGRSLSF